MKVWFTANVSMKRIYDNLPNEMRLLKQYELYSLKKIVIMKITAYNALKM